ncbi:hypothetical protein [Brevibacterium sp. SMBL_HHYL_HB1]|uniref:hypothetical protein n=1 Tax=Brevibacterium sp. SMBL_HHYL_HB1 TaxID=2777556 RepID=UPI001BABB8AB|nr:hypothetical protein [Brevibacterium sp. SMBL_HHYL_HB1]QUL79911.1 hypothetical protein IG171_03420 [Brevibacterium sp. SMBL_HHYL_HB1]
MDFPEALKQAPSLVAELRKRIMPEKGEKPERSAPSQKPSAPLNIHAMSDCDSIYSLLYRHAENVADLLGGTMPTVPIVGGWEPVGLPAGVEPDVAYENTLKLARYLEHQTHLVPVNWQRKIMREISKKSEELVKKYPTHAPKEQMNATCRACNYRLYRFPPKRYKADELYKCIHCGLVHTEQEAAEQEAKRSKKS